jgi:hypothetical protein
MQTHQVGSHGYKFSGSVMVKIVSLCLSICNIFSLITVHKTQIWTEHLLSVNLNVLYTQSKTTVQSIKT